MKAKTMINRTRTFTLSSLLILLVLGGCNKDFPNILKEHGEQADFTSGSSKVLYIIADGVRGKAMQELELPNFRVISRNSLYSFGSLGDYKTTNFTRETGLANLLTGVTNSKHQVTGTDLTVANLAAYPSILSRLNSTNSNYTSATFTADAAVSAALFNDADVKTVSADDAEVVAKATEELANGNSDFVVAHLTEAYKTGLEGSFEASDAAYLEALEIFDAQVGALIESVKARATYGQEDWLIIITSSIGGPAANTVVDNTSYGDNERHTITFFYSPKFTRSLLARPNSTEVPFDGNAVRYTYGANQVNATLANASLYNFGNGTDDFTINFFIKSNITTSHNYPVILSKRDAGFSGAGWNLFFEDRGGTLGNPMGWNSSISGQLFGTKRVNDGLWHNCTVVVHRSGSVDSVKLYTDGVFNVGTTAGASSLSNNAPLVIGRKVPDGNTSPDFLLANLQIYNTALTNEEVSKLSGIALIDDSHPKRTNLIGYWPGYNDIGTGRLTDLSGNNNHMILSGAYSWTSFSDVVSYFQPPITESFYKLVPNAVDLPFFIYQWFGIVPNTSWGLEGKSWTPSLLVSSN